MIKLPDTFEFKCFKGDPIDQIVYTATRENDTDFFRLNWFTREGRADDMVYREELLLNNFNNKIWFIIKCNGFDANGDPFNFTDDMLKPFQRIVTKDRGVFINTTTTDDHGLVLVGPDGWNNFIFRDPEDDDVYLQYEAVEIYNMPAFYPQARMDHTIFGDLVWRSESGRQKQIRELSESIDRDIDLLKTLKDEENN